MNLANSQLFCPIFFFLISALFSETFLRTLGQQIDWENEGSQNGFGHRILMSFKENPRGSNVTFECSPSGPCVPCLYSEKGDEKYRCSETGYRIPLKCIESEDSVKSSKKTDSQNAQSALDSSSTSGNSSQAYITYRSCIPSTTEDKLSFLSFEASVASMVIRLSLFEWCVQKTGPLFCTIFKPIGIIFTVIMGSLFFRDDFCLGSLVRAMIIVLGFYAVTWGKTKERNVEASFENLESSCHIAPLLQNKT